jgi:hypothetical protein
MKSVSKLINKINGRYRAANKNKSLESICLKHHNIRLLFVGATSFNDVYWAIKEFIWDNIDNE